MNWKATSTHSPSPFNWIRLSKLERSQTGCNGVDQIATSLQARKA